MSLLVQLGLIYVLVNTGAQVIYFAFAYAAAKLVQNCSLYFSYFQLDKKWVMPKWHPKLSKDLILASLPMMLAGSVGVLYSLQDQFFIKAMLNETELGIYSVGIKIVMMCIILPSIISNVFYPSLVSKFSQNKKSIYERQLGSLYVVFFVLGMIVFILFLFSAGFLIDFLFSAEFSRSAEVMRVYSLLLIFSFFQSLNNKVLILHGLQHVIFKRALMALTLNFILNLILIPRYGILGAAYSTVISEAFVIFSYAFRADTRFIFYYQLRAILLVDLFKPGLIRSIRA